MERLSDYQKRVVAATVELSSGDHWYEVKRTEEDLVIYPIGKLSGRGEIKFSFIRVSQNRMIGGDDCFTSELEERAREIERRPSGREFTLSAD